MTEQPAVTAEEALAAAGLTAGLSAEDCARALRFFDARCARFARGATLHRGGQVLPRFGLVLEGVVQVHRDDFDGRRILMASVGPGGVFGESLCYLAIPADISITALTDAKVLLLCADGLRAAPRTPLEGLLQRRFTAMLARRALAMNQRIQTLCRPGLRQRVMTFFAPYVRRFGRSFTVPFDRESMAAYLGVDRSALSRELSRMRRDGLLTFHKNHFTLLP